MLWDLSACYITLVTIRSRDMCVCVCVCEGDICQSTPSNNSSFSPIVPPLDSTVASNCTDYTVSWTLALHHEPLYCTQANYQDYTLLDWPWLMVTLIVPPLDSTVASNCTDYCVSWTLAHCCTRANY